MALYESIVSPLLDGKHARRTSWARGVFIYVGAINAAPLARLGLHHVALTLLTPSGPHRYFTHSIDRRATDWEVTNGPSYQAAGP